LSNPVVYLKEKPGQFLHIFTFFEHNLLQIENGIQTYNSSSSDKTESGSMNNVKHTNPPTEVMLLLSESSLSPVENNSTSVPWFNNFLQYLVNKFCRIYVRRHPLLSDYELVSS